MRTLRYLLGAALAALIAALPAHVSTRSESWAVGDLFVGIGTPASSPGRIDVYDARGVNKGQSIQIPKPYDGYTTGCHYNPESGTLWATTFTARSLHEFDGAREIRRISLAHLTGVQAVESIAFAPDGRSFFLGLPHSSPQIARYTYGGPAAGDAAGASAGMDRTFTIAAAPDGRAPRADWLDVTRENNDTVIYYTDESDEPRSSHSSVFRYVPRTGHQSVFARIDDSNLFALRLLPNGSGMLVAGGGHIYRLNMQGQVVQKYWAQQSGSYFALNVTPDGRHFWTATASADRSDVSGRLYLFSITAGGEPLVSVNTGAPQISGLCLKLEYTAARNVCTDPATGKEIPCPRLEVCNAGLDDDGDGLSDDRDPDCVHPSRLEPPQDSAPVCTGARPSVQQIWPPNHRMVEVGIIGVSDPNGDPVSIQVTAVSQDEPTLTVGDGTTPSDARLDGGHAFVRAERAGTPRVPGDGRVYQVSFTASANGTSCSGNVYVGVPSDQSGPAPMPGPMLWDAVTGAQIR